MNRYKEWHSISSKVYHNNKQCTEGNNIAESFLSNLRGLPQRKKKRTLCKKCERLNQNK